jgi:hypothetical protein
MSELAKDLVWSKAKRGMNGSNGGVFCRLSEMLLEDPTVTKSTLNWGWFTTSARSKVGAECFPSLIKYIVSNRQETKSVIPPSLPDRTEEPHTRAFPAASKADGGGA